MTGWRRKAIFGLCGALGGAAFVVPATAPGAVIGWCSAIALVLVYAQRPRPTNFEMWLAGAALHLTVFAWLLPVIKLYSELNLAVSTALFALFVGCAAVQFVVVNLVWRGLDGLPHFPRMLALPSAWLTVEVLWPRLIPWNLGHTQLPFSMFAQVADLLGAPLVSWLLLCAASLIVALVRSQRCGETRQSLRLAGALVFLCVCVLGYGTLRRSGLEADLGSRQGVRLAIVQPNLNPATDFRPDRLEDVIRLYRELSFSAVVKQPLDLLIWPESSVWTDYPLSISAVTPGAPDDPFPGLPVPLLFGGQTRLRNDGDGKPVYLNSIFLLRPGGTFAGSYHKTVLFPFSEEIPLERLIPALAVLNRKAYTMVRGPERQRPLPLATGSQGGTPPILLGVAICYEDMWSEPLRRQVKEGGANLLVALSDDAWFLHSVAARQHHLVASWRAIELRRFLVRATVDGVTAVVDPFGRSAATLPPFTKEVLLTAEARPLDGLSLYARVGGVPLQAVSVLLVGLAVCSTLRNRRKAVRPRTKSYIEVTEGNGRMNPNEISHPIDL